MAQSKHQNTENGKKVLRDWNLLRYSFDSFYNNWHLHPAKTVFIPESLNIQGYETTDGFVEHLAQSKLFSALLQADEVKKLGGIFVARFDMDKISKKIEKLKKDFKGEEALVKCWRTWATRRGGSRVDDNILVMHPQLGIVLLALNPAPVDSPLFQERYDIAKKAASDAQQVLSTLFGILTNYTKCDIDIEALVCLPETDASSEKQPGHLYKTQLEDINWMTEFWTNRIEESIKRHGKRNYFADPDFQKFARFIVSYRSSVTISAQNAHEIYHHPNMETVSSKEEDGKSVFCLNPRQLSSYLSVNKHQILFGLPGTGKTLLLMLLASKAVLEERSGKIFVVTGGKRLIKKYKKSFEGLKSQAKRQKMPIVQKNMALAKISDTDDFFTDEMQSVTEDWLAFLERRAKLEDVYTVIAVSGRAWATDVDQIMANVATVPELRGYHMVNLKTVVRGTKSIVKYWATKHLQEVPPIGHKDEGEPVIEESVGTTGGVLYRVKKHVLKLEEANFAHSHISVVTFNEHAAEDIVRYLNAQDIPACLAGKWAEDHVVVDFNNNVLSQEYPAVIVVNYYGYLGASESTEFTALTRAIARLVVIKKDRMIMQREIDAIMQKPENQGDVCIDMASVVAQATETLYSKESTAIKWKNSLESPDDWSDRLRAANDWDLSLAEIRYNLLPKFQLENKYFNKCVVCLLNFFECYFKVFSDVFEVLVNDDNAMRDFLRTHVPEDHPFYSYDIAHKRLQQFDYELALGPDHNDVRSEDMRRALLRFRERHLKCLEDYLTNTSKQDRKQNYGYLHDEPRWQPITRTVFTLG